MTQNAESRSFDISLLTDNIENLSAILDDVNKNISVASKALKSIAERMGDQFPAGGLNNELDNVAGGFSYNHSYDFNKGRDFLNEYSYESYTLSEKERQALRDAGCTFTLSEGGEISSVLDHNKLKLGPEEISKILNKQIEK